MIVRMIVEALEPEQLALGAVHLAQHLETHALIGVVAAPASRTLAVWCAAVDVAILKGEADRATGDLYATDVHRLLLTYDRVRAGSSYLRHRGLLVKSAAANKLPFDKLTGRAYLRRILDPASRRVPMDVSRRDLAVAGALALSVPGLLLGGFTSAEAAADEAAVTENVEVLRKALLEANKAKLEQVASAQISYGHSDGRVETKEQFINGVMTRKQTVKSLAFPELKVAVVGDAAIARHIYLAESELEGKQTTTKIGALQVWQKQNGSWKLLARQGFRLPAPA